MQICQREEISGRKEGRKEPISRCHLSWSRNRFSFRFTFIFFFSLCLSVHISAAEHGSQQGQQIHWSYRPLWLAGPSGRAASSPNHWTISSVPLKNLTLVSLMIRLFDHGLQRAQLPNQLFLISRVWRVLEGVSPRIRFKASKQANSLIGSFECSKDLWVMWELRRLWCFPNARRRVVCPRDQHADEQGVTLWKNRETYTMLSLGVWGQNRYGRKPGVCPTIGKAKGMMESFSQVPWGTKRETNESLGERKEMWKFPEDQQNNPVLTITLKIASPILENPQARTFKAWSQVPIPLSGDTGTYLWLTATEHKYYPQSFTVFLIIWCQRESGGDFYGLFDFR